MSSLLMPSKETKVVTEITYIPQINPSTATIEEMDAWLMAQGAEILDSEQLKEVVHKISWANVPGENPGDAEFSFASAW
jgi:hypothetical protein